jgi:hypothetical protein
LIGANGASLFWFPKSQHLVARNIHSLHYCLPRSFPLLYELHFAIVMFEVATSMTWLYQAETFQFLGIQAFCVLSAWVIASRDQEARAADRAVGKKKA